MTINYTIQDADGDQSSSTLTLTVAADSTPTVSVTDGTVDEKGLVDGSGELADPALNSDTSETTTGTFTITTGGDTLASLVVGGVDVTAGGVVNGTYGVLTVTNTAGNYTWSYTLSDNTLAHTDTVVDADSDRGADDQVFDNFSVDVTDRTATMPSSTPSTSPSTTTAQQRLRQRHCFCPMLRGDPSRDFSTLT